ncbi:1806_t:CDS:2, partial [Racocetra fulgida]
PSPVTTPPNLRNHSSPSFNSMNNSFNGESTEIEKESIEASPSESSKERRILDEKNHRRKLDFRILSKIDDVNTEFLFGEIKPPNNSTSINKSSLDLIIYSYGYVDGLETFGVLIY